MHLFKKLQEVEIPAGNPVGRFGGSPRGGKDRFKYPSSLLKKSAAQLCCAGGWTVSREDGEDGEQDQDRASASSGAED